MKEYRIVKIIFVIDYNLVVDNYNNMSKKQHKELCLENKDLVAKWYKKCLNHPEIRDMYSIIGEVRIYASRKNKCRLYGYMKRHIHPEYSSDELESDIQGFIDPDADSNIPIRLKDKRWGAVAGKVYRPDYFYIKN